MKISTHESSSCSMKKKKNKSKCSSVAATNSDEGIRDDRETEENKNRNKEKERGNKSTVLVGIKLDAHSKELLTWALVKVAAPGDLVIAVHVISDVSESETKLEESLLSILSVYDGFCNLKQIELKLKICRGSSIRKALVQEANSHRAAKLILGVAKNNHTFRPSSASIVKYCSKKLPSDCSVLAVTNGKIVFNRDPVLDSESIGDCGKDSVSKSETKEITRKSYTRLLSSGQKAPVLRSVSLPSPSPTTERESNPIAVSSKSKFEPLPSGCSSNQPNSGSDPDPISIRVATELTPGWPFLRKKFTLERKSDLSVVQWAMRLPNRYTAVSPSHLDHKLGTLDSSRDSIESSNGGAVIPFGTFLATTPPALDESVELETELPQELISLKEKYSSIYTLFSYKQLEQITSNFSPERIIGKGGSSSVYKGSLSNGRELAVKILKPSDEIMKEFVSEIEIISALNNKNVISLVGFCFENESLILVYDYLPRGSLEEILHGERESKKSFGWSERYKVALGIAQALNYLHGEGNDRPVIHRDVKSSNILLSQDFDPKLSDFGLALWASGATSHVTCNDVAGTFGYLAPEYFMFGKVNEKIDVYAFGVVLLELISGRKPVCSGCPKGQESLVIWANSILRDGKVWQLVDPSLSDEGYTDQIERMILAASICIRRTPHSRPQIGLVVKLLEGDNNILKWASSQAGVLSQDSNNEDGDNGIKLNDKQIQNYINLALLDVDDDSVSVSSVENPDFITTNTSLEEYLRGRWSRSSSFQ